MPMLLGGRTVREGKGCTWCCVAGTHGGGGGELQRSLGLVGGDSVDNLKPCDVGEVGEVGDGVTGR